MTDGRRPVPLEGEGFHAVGIRTLRQPRAAERAGVGFAGADGTIIPEGRACRADRAVSAEKAGVCRSRARPAARAAAWKGASPPFCPCRIGDPARGSPCLPSPARASPEPGEQQREAETGMGGMCRPASRGTGRIGQPGRALLSVRADGTGGDAASRARPWFYSCMPSTRLASRTFSGSSSKT